jgi:hypothetical protein
VLARPALTANDYPLGRLKAPGARDSEAHALFQPTLFIQ